MDAHTHEWPKEPAKDHRHVTVFYTIRLCLFGNYVGHVDHSVHKAVATLAAAQCHEPWAACHMLSMLSCYHAIMLSCYRDFGFTYVMLQMCTRMFQIEHFE